MSNTEFSLGQRVESTFDKVVGYPFTKGAKGTVVELKHFYSGQQGFGEQRRTNYMVRFDGNDSVPREFHAMYLKGLNTPFELGDKVVIKPDVRPALSATVITIGTNNAYYGVIITDAGKYKGSFEWAPSTSLRMRTDESCLPRVIKSLAIRVDKATEELKEINDRKNQLEKWLNEAAGELGCDLDGVAGVIRSIKKLVTPSNSAGVVAKQAQAPTQQGQIGGGYGKVWYSNSTLAKEKLL